MFIRNTFSVLFLFFFSIASFSQNLNMSLVGEYYSTWTNSKGSDLCGWVDSNGNEYAIVGLRDRVSVVNISNPANPFEEFYIDESAYLSNWRDIKTWGNYAYVTTEAFEGLLIIDLTDMSGGTFSRVSTFTNPNNSTSEYFLSARNLYIDENGVAHIFGAMDPAIPVNDPSQPSGVIFLDLTANPTNPVYLGGWHNSYINDGMARGDTLWAACIGQGEFLAIDVSNKSNPSVLAQQATPVGSTNNCWISDDGDYLFVSEQIANGYIVSYDVSNLNNIIELDKVQANPSSGASPKNVVVDGDFLICSYFTEGTIVYDIKYPNNLIKVAYYDSYSGVGSGYDGTWGIYPFLPSNLILASDLNTNPTLNGKLNIYDRQFQQACYLEGNVIDASTNMSLDGVNINILATQSITSSNLSGDYQVGVASSGSYDVVFSKSMYQTDTFNITLTNGNITTLNVSLDPVPAFGINGTVINSSGSPLIGADVLIYNANISHQTTTNSNGSFTINAVNGQYFYDDFYEIIVGKWGYRTSCSSQFLTSNSNNISVTLNEGYYDDFVFDFGWTISGDATDGMWEIGVPEGTSSQGASINPGNDITIDCYINAYVTDPDAGSQTGSNDVDDGYTLLTSPMLDLSSYSTPYVHYYRWFANAYGSSPDDSLIVRISDGNTVVDVEIITANSPNLSSWQSNSFKVSDYLAPTSSMQVIFYTADLYNGSGNYVEAGVDKFQITNSSTPPVYTIEDINIADELKIYPNPTNNFIILESKEMGSVQIFNILGELLYSSKKSTLLKKINLPEFNNGFYILRLNKTYGKFLKE